MLFEDTSAQANVTVFWRVQYPTPRIADTTATEELLRLLGLTGLIL